MRWIFLLLMCVTPLTTATTQSHSAENVKRSFSSGFSKKSPQAHNGNDVNGDENTKVYPEARSQQVIQTPTKSRTPSNGGATVRSPSHLNSISTQKRQKPRKKKCPQISGCSRFSKLLDILGAGCTLPSATLNQNFEPSQRPQVVINYNFGGDSSSFAVRSLLDGLLTSEDKRELLKSLLARNFDSCGTCQCLTEKGHVNAEDCQFNGKSSDLDEESSTSSLEHSKQSQQILKDEDDSKIIKSHDTEVQYTSVSGKNSQSNRQRQHQGHDGPDTHSKDDVMVDTSDTHDEPASPLQETSVSSEMYDEINKVSYNGKDNGRLATKHTKPSIKSPLNQEIGRKSPVQRSTPHKSVDHGRSQRHFNDHAMIDDVDNEQKERTHINNPYNAHQHAKTASKDVEDDATHRSVADSTLAWYIKHFGEIERAKGLVQPGDELVTVIERNLAGDASSEPDVEGAQRKRTITHSTSLSKHLTYSTHVIHSTWKTKHSKFRPLKGHGLNEKDKELIRRFNVLPGSDKETSKEVITSMTTGTRSKRTTSEVKAGIYSVKHIERKYWKQLPMAEIVYDEDTSGEVIEGTAKVKYFNGYNPNSRDDYPERGRKMDSDSSEAWINEHDLAIKSDQLPSRQTKVNGVPDSREHQKNRTKMTTKELIRDSLASGLEKTIESSDSHEIRADYPKGPQRSAPNRRKIKDTMDAKDQDNISRHSSEWSEDDETVDISASPEAHRFDEKTKRRSEEPKNNEMKDGKKGRSEDVKEIRTRYRDGNDSGDKSQSDRWSEEDEDVSMSREVNSLNSKGERRRLNGLKDKASRGDDTQLKRQKNELKNLKTKKEKSPMQMKGEDRKHDGKTSVEDESDKHKGERGDEDEDVTDISASKEGNRLLRESEAIKSKRPGEGFERRIKKNRKETETIPIQEKGKARNRHGKSSVEDDISAAREGNRLSKEFEAIERRNRANDDRNDKQNQNLKRSEKKVGHPSKDSVEDDILASKEGNRLSKESQATGRHSKKGSDELSENESKSTEDHEDSKNFTIKSGQSAKEEHGKHKGHKWSDEDEDVIDISASKEGNSAPKQSNGGKGDDTRRIMEDRGKIDHKKDEQDPKKDPNEDHDGSKHEATTSEQDHSKNFTITSGQRGKNEHSQHEGHERSDEDDAVIDISASKEGNGSLKRKKGGISNEIDSNKRKPKDNDKVNHKKDGEDNRLPEASKTKRVPEAIERPSSGGFKRKIKQEQKDSTNFTMEVDTIPIQEKGKARNRHGKSNVQDESDKHKGERGDEDEDVTDISASKEGNRLSNDRRRIAEHEGKVHHQMDVRVPKKSPILHKSDEWSAEEKGVVDGASKENHRLSEASKTKRERPEGFERKFREGHKESTNFTMEADTIPIQMKGKARNRHGKSSVEDDISAAREGNGLSEESGVIGRRNKVNDDRDDEQNQNLKRSEKKVAMKNPSNEKHDRAEDDISASKEGNRLSKKSEAASEHSKKSSDELSEDENRSIEDHEDSKNLTITSVQSAKKEHGKHKGHERGDEDDEVIDISASKEGNKTSKESEVINSKRPGKDFERKIEKEHKETDTIPIQEKGKARNRHGKSSVQDDISAQKESNRLSKESQAPTRHSGRSSDANDEKKSIEDHDGSKHEATTSDQDDSKNFTITSGQRGKNEHDKHKGHERSDEDDEVIGISASKEANNLSNESESIGRHNKVNDDRYDKQNQILERSEEKVLHRSDEKDDKEEGNRLHTLSTEKHERISGAAGQSEDGAEKRNPSGVSLKDSALGQTAAIEMKVQENQSQKSDEKQSKGSFKSSMSTPTHGNDSSSRESNEILEISESNEEMNSKSKINVHGKDIDIPFKGKELKSEKQQRLGATSSHQVNTEDDRHQTSSSVKLKSTVSSKEAVEQRNKIIASQKELDINKHRNNSTSKLQQSIDQSKRLKDSQGSYEESAEVLDMSVSSETDKRNKDGHQNNEKEEVTSNGELAKKQKDDNGDDDEIFDVTSHETRVKQQNSERHIANKAQSDRNNKGTSEMSGSTGNRKSTDAKNATQGRINPVALKAEKEASEGKDDEALEIFSSNEKTDGDAIRKETPAKGCSGSDELSKVDSTEGRDRNLETTSSHRHHGVCCLSDQQVKVGLKKKLHCVCGQHEDSEEGFEKTSTEYKTRKVEGESDSSEAIETSSYEEYRKVSQKEGQTNSLEQAKASASQSDSESEEFEVTSYEGYGLRRH